MSLAGWLPKNAFVMRKKIQTVTSTASESKTQETATTHSVSSRLMTKGNPLSKILFITAEPIVGEAQTTFEKMVIAMSFQMKDVLVSFAEEISPATSTEIRVLFEKIYPEVVVCLGNEALEIVRPLNLENVKIVSIPHPSEFIQAPELKKTAWNELKKVMTILGIKK